MKFLKTAGWVFASLVISSSAEAATRSFVTLRDDGTLAKKITDPGVVARKVMKLYDAAGATRPDVISLWTSFPMGGDIIPTLFDPLGNETTGIGLEHEYLGGGVFDSDYPPVRSILLHNDFTKLDERAKYQNADPQNFGRYLFLLELSHNWGPALRVPPVDGGAAADELIGFSFHWSFWMDATGSPAGGNAWKDNGDGTFSVSGQSPSTVKYSMLDLYIMGLADPSEVPPFGVLENAVPPKDVVDPFTHGAYAASSFPWFGDQPFTVKATRRTLTIQDIVAENGPRAPARSVGQLKLGIVLAVASDASDDDVADLEARFEPFAATLAPSFKEATSGRGAFTLVTASEVPDPPGQSDPPASGATAAPASSAPAAAPQTKATTSGCNTGASSVDAGASGAETNGAAPLGLALLGFAGCARARRSRRR
jgi:hypothetical protein